MEERLELATFHWVTLLLRYVYMSLQQELHIVLNKVATHSKD